MRISVLFSLTCILASLCPAAYQNISWKNPSPTGNDLYDVAVNLAATQFLLVGENGTIATAADGVTWQFRSSNTTADLHGCVYGAATALAVGDGGTILRSSDGITWVAATGLTADFKDVTYGAGLYVAVGSNGGSAYAATSADGVVWSEVNTGLSDSLSSVAFQGTTFVIVGSSGSVATSQNGSTWTPITPFTSSDLVAVAPGLGGFIAISAATSGNRVFTSQTGATWIAGALPSTTNGLNLNNVTYNSGNYIITADQGQIVTSADASIWTARVVKEGYDGDFLAGVGSILGTNIVGRGGAAFRSLGGLIGWSQFMTGPVGDFTALLYGGNFIVTVGNDGKIAATGGNNIWSMRNSGTTQNLTGVAYGKNYWVAVGAQGTIRVTNFEADNWTSRTSPLNVDLSCIVYGNNRFYAGGPNGTLITSSNSNVTNWSQASAVTNQDITTLAYENNTFLAGTSDGSVLISSDSVSWTLALNVVSGYVEAITYFDGKYWLVANSPGGESMVYSSPNGTGWTLIYSVTNGGLNTLAVTGDWLAATSPGGNVLSTQDGITWDYESGVLSPGFLATIPYAGGLLATGNYSKVAVINVGYSLNTYFNNPAPLGNGWYLSSWLGAFNGLNYPTVYTMTQGFWYCSGDGMANGANSYWIYDYKLGWLWTNNGSYPWVYVSEHTQWAYYNNTYANTRWYFFQNTGWQAIPLSQ